ncbi:hypothetical protein AKJ09_03167 [Labilithrix luteola]|uniref:Uncharacterized protein n=2 Tax=Labilithrix luteola TaxID=1391654 RepID=A0A0K1PSI9_9BACT|nr:hypothetical protein AKJ09_03167 [Labilithrix luteola]
MATGKLVTISDRTEGDALYRVLVDGTATRVWPPRDRAPIFTLHEELGVGSDEMQASPDGQRVAYVEDGVLNVSHLEDGSTIGIFRAPHIEDAIFVTAWSPDSHALLYALERRLPGNPDDEASTYDAARFFLYDFRSRTTTSMSLPGEFHGWLPSGEIILLDGDQALLFADGKHRPLLSDRVRLGQLDVSADGSRIVAMAAVDHGSQVVSIDPRAERMKPLGTPRRHADVQWPHVSPNGEIVARMERGRTEGGIPEWAVFIEERQLTPFAKTLRSFTWLDEATLAVLYDHELLVIARDGTVKGRPQLR